MTRSVYASQAVATDWQRLLLICRCSLRMAEIPCLLKVGRSPVTNRRIDSVRAFLQLLALSCL